MKAAEQAVAFRLFPDCLGLRRDRSTRAMHPPLERPHPDCQDAIAALKRCHEESKWGKWVGACNSIKEELDWCLRKEKEAVRDANLIKARAWDAKFEAYVAKKQQNQQNSR